jgi:hypothetical protein
MPSLCDNNMSHHPNMTSQPHWTLVALPFVVEWGLHCCQCAAIRGRKLTTLLLPHQSAGPEEKSSSVRAVDSRAKCAPLSLSPLCTLAARPTAGRLALVAAALFCCIPSLFQSLSFCEPAQALLSHLTRRTDPLIPRASGPAKCKPLTRSTPNNEQRPWIYRQGCRTCE